MPIRFHYCSDLHLEIADYDGPIPSGDVLLLAGDVAPACYLGPQRTDRQSLRQRQRLFRFVERCTHGFEKVLWIAGNHEHYHGDYNTTHALMRTVAGVQVLENEAIEIGDTLVVGTTLWSDFEGADPASMERVQDRLNDYHCVRHGKRGLQAEDTLAAHRQAVEFICQSARDNPHRRVVVLSHHAPTWRCVDGKHADNDLNGGYCSDLEWILQQCPNIVEWVFGHTHVQTTLTSHGATLRANCRGYDPFEDCARSFDMDRWFELSPPPAVL